MNVYYYGNYYKAVVLRQTPKRMLVRFTTKKGDTLERWVELKRVLTDEALRDMRRKYHEYRKQHGLL